MGVAREVIRREGGEGWEEVGRSVVARFCRRRWVAVGACHG